MKKTKKETIDELKKEFSNIENIYKSKCVNWTGTTKDSDELYSEIIANELLQNINEFENISTISRTKTYCRENHSDIYIDSRSNRKEEIFAKRITGLKLGGLGLIKDFQIPLKDKREDKGLGKIDLISFNDKTMILYLIELKYEGNKETLLRASLEGYIYYKIIDKVKLIEDFCGDDIDSTKINVKPVVLVTHDCKAYKELKDVRLGNRPKFKELVHKLDICFFTVEILSNEVFF